MQILIAKTSILYYHKNVVSVAVAIRRKHGRENFKRSSTY